MGRKEFQQGNSRPFIILRNNALNVLLTCNFLALYRIWKKPRAEILNNVTRPYTCIKSTISESQLQGMGKDHNLLQESGRAWESLQTQGGVAVYVRVKVNAYQIRS